MSETRPHDSSTHDERGGPSSPSAREPGSERSSHLRPKASPCDHQSAKHRGSRRRSAQPRWWSLDLHNGKCAQSRSNEAPLDKLMNCAKRQIHQAAARKLCLPWINWRCLRTSHATWMVEAGANPKDVQGQMRHSRASRPRWTSTRSSSRNHSGALWRRCRQWSSLARQSRLHQLAHAVLLCRRNRGW
jgi:hypothetical protein